MNGEGWKALDEAATPGPWRPSLDHRAAILGPEFPQGGSEIVAELVTAPNWQLIIALRNMAPALLEAADRLTEAVQRVIDLYDAEPKHSLSNRAPRQEWRSALFEARRERDVALAAYRALREGTGG